MDLAGINFSVLVSNFSVLILALEPVNEKFDAGDVCRDVMASELILDTRSNNEPELESETELEIFASVNIEDGTENRQLTRHSRPDNSTRCCMRTARTYVRRIT